MKIFIIINSLNIGGTETQLVKILSALTNDFSFYVYTIQEPGALAKILKEKNIPVMYYSGTNLLNKHKFLQKIRYLFLMIHLCWKLLKIKPNIVHCYMPKSYLLGGWCAWLTRQKCILMSRRTQNVYQQKYPWLKKIEFFLHKKLKFCIANSEKIVQELLTEGIPRGKIKKIYNGVEESGYHKTANAKLKQQLGIEKKLVLIIVANGHGHKGHADLLYALSILLKQLSPSWCLLCVGRIDPTLEKLTLQLQLQDFVMWLGERNDIPELLSAADIGLLVSHREGFANAILEYMAAGLPVITTDVGGNREAVQQGVNGFVVPPKNPPALAQAILSLITDKSLRISMGLESKQKIKNFTLAECVQEHKNLYQDLYDT